MGAPSTKPRKRAVAMMALRQENGELLQFLYACPVGVVALDADGTMTMLNPLAMRLVLPLARDGEVTNLFKLLEPYAPELRTMVAGFAATHGAVCENHRIFVGQPAPAGRRAGSEARDTVLACTLVRLDAARLMATLLDVSADVAQERRLKQAEAWFSSLVEGVEDFASLSLDAGGLIDHVSESLFRQIGFAAGDLVGRSIEVLDAPDLASGSLPSREQIALAMRDGWHLDESWCAHRDGSRRWCQRLISVHREDGGPDGRAVAGFTVVLRIVARRDGNVNALRKRLTTDPLTEVANRAHFFEVAGHVGAGCRRNKREAALILLDIDHFKRVNDTFGHATGDEVLKGVAKVCRGLLRPEDTLARLGGEEFAVLAPRLDREQALDVAERLRRAVAEAVIPTSCGAISVSASFGCAILDACSSDVAAALAEADAALYAAKHAGRNRVSIAPVRAAA